MGGKFGETSCGLVESFNIGSLGVNITGFSSKTESEGKGVDVLM